VVPNGGRRHICGLRDRPGARSQEPADAIQVEGGGKDSPAGNGLLVGATSKSVGPGHDSSMVY
jgi:hypothetical protein